MNNVINGRCGVLVKVAGQSSKYSSYLNVHIPVSGRVHKEIKEEIIKP